MKEFKHIFGFKDEKTINLNQINMFEESKLSNINPSTDQMIQQTLADVSSIRSEMNDKVSKIKGSV